MRRVLSRRTADDCPGQVLGGHAKGMTLVEVMVAMLIFTVSVYLLSSTITATIAHSSIKRERAMAVEAAMNILERMRNERFDELFASYNTVPTDDPGGVGTAPGSNFAVVGLTAWDDDADALAGEVLLPSSLAVLREDTENRILSMPRDLNADLMIDDLDHARDYVVLPVTVRVAWKGKAGNRSFEMSTMFAKLEKLDE